MGNAYSQRKGVDPASIRFAFDGAFISPDQTPADFEMEDDDVVDCMLSQIGGMSDGVKPEEGAKGEAITIKVKDQQGEETHFKIKTTTKFHKVFNAYSQRKGVDPASIRFAFDGQHINPEQTPADIDMEDEDVIDCMLQQLGGMSDGVKPEEGAKGEAITIKVKDQNGEETHFKIKTTTKFHKVLNAYSQRKGVDAASIRFTFDGQRIRPEQTPAEYEMEDEDVIDCMLEQLGGGSTHY